MLSSATHIVLEAHDEFVFAIMISEGLMQVLLQLESLDRCAVPILYEDQEALPTGRWHFFSATTNTKHRSPF